jgi:hypothetical protein
MIDLLIWTLSLGLGLGLLAFTEAYDLYALNTLIAMAVSGNLIALALRGMDRELPHVSLACIRVADAIGLLAAVWTWLAVANTVLVVDVYGFFDSTARIGGFAAAAILCASVAVLMRHAAARAGAEGPAGTQRLRRMLRLTLLLAAMQVMAALALATALVASGLLGRIAADWSGNTVLFFGAVALAAIAAQAVMTIDRALALVALSRPLPAQRRAAA